eukprot:scaffold18754_cov54-Phaeocystis_antarctica.AAC.4
MEQPRPEAVRPRRPGQRAVARQRRHFAPRRSAIDLPSLSGAMSRTSLPILALKGTKVSAVRALRIGYEVWLTSTIASFSVGAASAVCGAPASSDAEHAAARMKALASATFGTAGLTGRRSAALGTQLASTARARTTRISGCEIGVPDEV